MKSVILIAPPAAGKGTMASMLSKTFNMPHISTGDLLRNEMSNQTSLGLKIKDDMEKGNLVSDEIITELLINRLTKPDCENGYILDGYPRNVEQAYIYEDILDKLDKEIGVVIFLDIDKATALYRMSGRIVCATCGASYNLNNVELQPKVEGICDDCKSPLNKRSDDNVDTFNNRFDTYINKTSSLINYYQEQGVLERISIDASSTANSTFEAVKKILKR